MRDRAKRRRLNSDTSPVPETIPDKSSWNGFCEIESEPVISPSQYIEPNADFLYQAYFNVMLREFGVEGVKVQELFTLDDEMIDQLPYVSPVLEPLRTTLTRTCSSPVYGIIFLFRWHEDNPEKQEASCPDGLWFANQVCSNVL